MPNYLTGGLTVRCRFIIWIGCILLALFLGCVSKTQFKAVNNDYQLAQQKISKGGKKLEESEKEIDLCRKDLTKLQNQNMLLSQKIEPLSQSIKKKDSVISLQETVIRLFDDSKQTLQTSIKEQIAAQEIEPSTSPPPMKLVLVSKLLFKSGSADLGTEGKTLLKKLTGLMQEEPYPYIQVHGHTDDRSLKSNAMYATNWELSIARAATVVRFLQETVGIEPWRISATGFGQYRPIASNETDEGQRQNRRIEIILEASKPKGWVERAGQID
jgi:chemotaxis protein MotB